MAQTQFNKSITFSILEMGRWTLYPYSVAILLSLTLLSIVYSQEPCQGNELEIANYTLTEAVRAIDLGLAAIDDSGSDAQEALQRWFGTVDSNGLEAIRNTLLTSRAFAQGVTFYCLNSTTEETFSVFAYVYSDQPFTIYLGNLFFEASTSGFDSQLGILIHELTHFTLTGATGDSDSYEVQYALELAASDPATAIRTANNYEYFIESILFGL